MASVPSENSMVIFVHVGLVVALVAEGGWRLMEIDGRLPMGMEFGPVTGRRCARGDRGARTPKGTLFGQVNMGQVCHITKTESEL